MTNRTRRTRQGRAAGAAVLSLALTVGGFALGGCGKSDSSAPRTNKLGNEGSGGGQSRTDKNGAQGGGSDTGGATTGNNGSGGGGNQSGGSGSP